MMDIYKPPSMPSDGVDISVCYDRANSRDFSALTIASKGCDKEGYPTRVYNVLIGEDADIMLEILTNKDVARKAIDYIKGG